MGTILKRAEAVEVIRKHQSEGGPEGRGERVVFTNGCFDILHVGHTRLLRQASEHGEVLVVGLNSDGSVGRLKGTSRPVVPEDQRAEMLAALWAVDYVVIFEEDEPKSLIEELMPDVLVKGADWADYVSGRDIVEANGGEVVLLDLVDGVSTTGLLKRASEKS